MIEQGVIPPSNSPCVSLMVMAIDHEAVSAKTIKDNYPLPNITDVLDKLGRCQYITTVDLASGFHQIEMNPDDIKKTYGKCGLFNIVWMAITNLQVCPLVLKMLRQSFEKLWITS